MPITGTRQLIGAAAISAAAATAAVLVASSITFAAHEPAEESGHRETDSLVFRRPVDAPVADPFRVSENPYGPGNRGIEYDTTPGAVVLAAATGTVTFAGAVAGELYVTLNHGGGVLSSYSYLDRISVSKGATVPVGSIVGIAGERLHFSVRVNGEYVDPAMFMATRRVIVRLVG